MYDGVSYFVLLFLEEVEYTLWNGIWTCEESANPTGVTVSIILQSSFDLKNIFVLKLLLIIHVFRTMNSLLKEGCNGN